MLMACFLNILLSGAQKATTVVQLYSFSNYHWYMKQEFKYHDWELADLLWDPENPMNLTAICRY